jgi:CIC family chloride channel protein
MRLNIDELVETDFNVIYPEQTLGQLVEVITKAHRNIFPVTEEDGQFRGIVKLDDIRNIMFKRELYEEVKVKDLMFMPEHTIVPNENMEEVARKFQDSGRFNIAVLKDGKYLGFISRARLFSAYRKALSDVSEH